MPKRLNPGLLPEHVVHPQDRAGIQRVVQALSLPVLKDQIRNLQDEVEDACYTASLEDHAKLSENQGGRIFRIVAQVAETLGVDPPQVFLDRSLETRATSISGNSPSIILSSGLLQTLSEEQLCAVIGHELGHILCRHTFYRLLAENTGQLSTITQVIPYLGPFLSGSLIRLLLDWYRKSELTGDRMALLAVQDITVVRETLLILAVGSQRLAEEFSVQGFVNQAEEYEEKAKPNKNRNIQDRIGTLFSDLLTQPAMNTHPRTAIRMKEIGEWASSRHYGLLLEGDYQQAVLLASASSSQDPGEEDEPGEESVPRNIVETTRLAESAIKGFWHRLNRSSETHENPEADEASESKRDRLS